MRAKLLQKIQGQQAIQSLDLRITCSLIHEFLKFHSFTYTLSVFLPECGDSSALLSSLELAEYFQIDSSCNQSLLDFLLSKLPLKPASTKHSSSQTLETSAISSLESQLLDLDLKHASQKASTDPTLEEKILKIQKDCESRMKLELESNLKRIREIEIVNMKLEEAHKYQELLKKYKDDNEKSYLRELDLLKAKEKKLNESFRSKEQELENKSFAWRQEMLLNLEKTQKSGQELRKKVNLEEEELQRLKEIWAERVKECENKAEKLVILEKEASLRAQEDFLRYKLEFESKFEDEKRKLALEKAEIAGMKKTFDLDSDRIKGSADRLENFEFLLEKMKTENKVLKEQNHLQAVGLEQLRNELKIVAETQNLLVNQMKCKESENKVMKDEIESLKTVNGELKMMANEAKAKFEKEKNDLMNEIKGYSGSNVVSNYISEHKYHWSKLQREEAEIRTNFLENLKPALSSATKPNPSQAPNTKATLKSFLPIYNSDSSQSSP